MTSEILSHFLCVRVCDGVVTDNGGRFSIPPLDGEDDCPCLLNLPPFIITIAFLLFPYVFRFSGTSKKEVK